MEFCANRCKFCWRSESHLDSVFWKQTMSMVKQIIGMKLDIKRCWKLSVHFTLLFLSSFNWSLQLKILHFFKRFHTKLLSKYYLIENVYLMLATMRSWHFLLSSGILNIRLEKQIVGKRPEWSDSNLIGPDSDSGFQNGLRCNNNFWSVTSIKAVFLNLFCFAEPFST